jgi:ribonuclease E
VQVEAPKPEPIVEPVERAEPVVIAQEQPPAPPQVHAEAAVRPERARVDPQEYLASAGLQMVETKSGTASAPANEESVKLGRPRRQREAAAEEPLVQVETHK